MKKNEEYLSLLFYLLISVLSILPFFSSGFFQIHDDVQVARVYEMAKSLSSGVFPVRWVSDLGYGFGYPLFNFYSVLPYYIGGALSLFGVDALFATKAVFILGIVGSGFSMYLLVSKFFGKAAALVSSVIYLYFPYHAVNIYVRGDLAELFAYALIPLVFLSVFKIHESEKFERRFAILGSVAIAGVILSHNLSAFMLFIFIGFFMIYSITFSKSKRNRFFSYTTILGIAFMLSAFYAVPAALEAKYTNVASIVGGGSDFHDHFICLPQLWDSPWGFGGSVPGCIDGVSFKLGKLNVILALLGTIFALIYGKALGKKGSAVFASILFLLFSLFMATGYSLPFWNIPFMDFLQFPWRFLNFSGLFLSFISGFLVWIIQEKGKARYALIISVIIILLTLYTNFRLFTPQKILDRNAVYYTNLFYLNWTASKISDEYMPKGFNSPKSYSDSGKINIDSIKNDFFINSSGHFSSRQTTLEVVSDIVSLIGVLVLVAVIINKPRIYGKKAS